MAWSIYFWDDSHTSDLCVSDDLSHLLRSVDFFTTERCIIGNLWM
jgi:hypothetical protein